MSDDETVETPNWRTEAEAARIERDRLRDDIVSLRMLLTETKAERDQVQDERDLFRDQALPEAATVMNGLSAALIEGEAERDRLQARVLELEAQVGERERHLRDALKDMRAERDRLRALVQGAQEWTEVHKVWMDRARGEGVRPTDEVSRRRAATAAAMLDLVDHLDPPDGDGGATIELLAAMYGCVRDLITERDRLRTVVDALVQWRDAQERFTMADIVADISDARDEAETARQAVWLTLAQWEEQLDGSAEATDG